MDELNAGRPRSPLLSYRRGNRRVPLTPADVNSHVRSLTGGAFTAKDFRTLRGTILAAEALARIGTVDPERTASAPRCSRSARPPTRSATPRRWRADSYIDPGVFTAYRRGELLALDVSPESAIQRLLVG